MDAFTTWAIIIGFVVLVVFKATKDAKLWEGTPPSPSIVCPHCHEKGCVKTRRVTRKKGISGGKATGAFLTGGASMLGTGLSRKQTVTEMTCTECNTVWDVA